MAKNLVYIGIAVLALIAVVLGYKIYQQKALNIVPLTTQPTQDRTTTGTVKQTTPATTQTNAAPQNIDVNTLVNNLVKPDNTQAERDRLATTTRLAAIKADVLDISNCNPNPSIFQVKKGAEFKVKNSNSIDQKIMITPQQQYNAPANQTVTLKADFGPGIISYRCNKDNGYPLVGIFFVE